MFNSEHYIPILKWKRAEQGALKSLVKECRKHMTPLIQFVMPKPNENDKLEDVVARFRKQMNEIPKKISDVWGTDPIFIDVSLLFTTRLKADALKTIVLEGDKLGSTFIPVIHLDDDNDLKKIAFSLARRNGLCLRLVCPNFNDFNKFKLNMAELLITSGLEENIIDLLVDIKEIDDNEGKYLNYLGLAQNIPNLKCWRTFIFAAGSFPEDMTGCKLDEVNLLPRADWVNWRRQARNSKMRRYPAFADYTIQHPIYREVTQFFPPTSSIKYTLENEWLVMKGKKQRFELYLANAAVLVKDDRFYGRNFSDGDKYISEKAAHFSVYIKNPSVKGTGSTETWLKAGINHHLTLVANQIANLP